MAEVIHTCRVVGTTHGNGQSILSKMRVGDYVTLSPQPTNVYDENAIQVSFMGEHLGYLPAAYAKAIKGRVKPETIGKIVKISGGTEQYPNRGCEVEFPVAAEAEATHE